MIYDLDAFVEFAMWYQSAEQEMWERGWMLCFAIGEI